MRNANKIWTSILSTIIMLILVLDSQTSLRGAKEGITICLYTVIPALFPFLILSCLINSSAMGLKYSWLRPLGKLCGIPAGSEYILLLGLIGGYPVGAQSIYHASKNNALSETDAKRMLGFCNNAGPSFIFGMMSLMFPDKRAVLLLWLVHIASAILVGIALPNKSKHYCKIDKYAPLSLVSALEISLIYISTICGWVILFRIIIAFLNRWILWILPVSAQSLIVGLLELSNGCISLYSINPAGVRFIISSVILSFGGCCVCMQTKSATKGLGLGLYFPGKIMQCAISFLLSCVIQQWFFPFDEVIKLPTLMYILPSVLLIFGLYFMHHKNYSRNLKANSV